MPIIRDSPASIHLNLLTACPSCFIPFLLLSLLPLTPSYLFTAAFVVPVLRAGASTLLVTHTS